MPALPPGLYERLLTLGLREALAGTAYAAEIERPDAAEAPHHLARHLGGLVGAVLRRFGSTWTEECAVSRRCA